jgi:drug/metabolite transporter (DMT)-like permease
LLLEPLLFKERFRPRDAIVVGACVLGMALFFVGRLRPQDVAGNLAALGSGLCFALFTLSLRHSGTNKVNRASAVIYGNLLLALVCAPAFWSRLTGPPLAARDAGIVAFLGVVQIGLAYTLFTRGIARGVRALDAGIVGYIEPVLNPLWVFLFVGERPGVWALAGGAIIVGAVALHARTAAATNRKPLSNKNG